ncbi:MAG: ATP-binding protein [Candidatus Bipolaricaulota bacterium]
MNELVVISGKGGTGKTTVVGSLAALAGDKLTADCDVDAANLNLLMGNQVQDTERYEGSELAVIDQSECTGCGMCREACRFRAILHVNGSFGVDPLSCEGCGVCAYVCPAGAVTLNPRLSGHVYVSRTPYGTLVHGELRPGEEATGKLVAQVKQRARQRAASEGRRLLLVDGAPGIGCPVIASLAGATAVLVVTEPSVSALHDLERAVALARHFGAQIYLAMNKADLERAAARKTQRWAAEQKLPLVGWIPYDEEATRAQVDGCPLVTCSDGPAARALLGLWKRLQKGVRS